VNELALFAGAGGGILAGTLLGWRCVCAVERDAYAATVLAQRQNDGVLDPFPIWSDVCSFDGKPWCGIVDVVSGGFPCQDISAAGSGTGIDGERSGLWREMARIVREVRPRFVFVENSPMLTSRGLGRVLGDLAAMGFDAEWGVLSAAAVGAPHLRERIWILAYADGWRRRSDIAGGRDRYRNVAGWNQANGEPGASSVQALADAGEVGLPSAETEQRLGWRFGSAECRVDSRGWWRIDPADSAEPNVGRVAHGVAHRVDRIKSLGNGQVPACAAAAWRQLFARINQE
jgi:DNA (cytosine-5)-methyltransferase 1